MATYEPPALPPDLGVDRPDWRRLPCLRCPHPKETGE